MRAAQDATKLAKADPTRSLLAGRYAYVRELGRGAEGRVILAEDRSEGGALRAIKVVAEPHAERVRWEFALLSGLSHPNLARVFELVRVVEPVPAFDVPRGALALVSEVAPGQSADRVARLHGRDRDGRLQLAWLVLDRTTRALAALHAQGFVHGDVKPSNVVVAADLLDAKLVDLGLARAPGVTREVSGTVGFIAPEQLRGELLPASDVYALGQTLRHVLAPETDRADASHLPALASWIPASLAQLIERMCAGDPHTRPRSALELLPQVEVALRDAGAGPPGSAAASRVPPVPLSARARALEVTALPLTGQSAAANALLDALEGGGVVAVVGPHGSGRSRLVRHVVGVMQSARAQAGQATPTYVSTLNLPTQPLASDSIVHVHAGDPVSFREAEALVRSARVAGWQCTLVLERTRAAEAGASSVVLGPLSQEDLASLLSLALPQAPVKAPYVREAAAVSGGLAGRLCRVLAAGLLAGEDMARAGALRAHAAPDAASDVDIPEYARGLAEVLAVAGGTLSHEIALAAMVELAALSQAATTLGLLGLCTLGEQGSLELRADVTQRLLSALPLARRRALAKTLLATGVAGRPRALASVHAGELEQARAVALAEVTALRARGDAAAAARLAVDVLAALPAEASHDLRLQLADALRALGRYDEALLALADAQGAAADVVRAEVSRLLGKRSASVQLAEGVIARAESAPATSAALVLRARVALDDGDAALAKHILDRAAVGGDEATALRAIEVSALLDLHVGALEPAQLGVERGLAAARAAGDKAAEARLSSVAATVAAARGELLLARRLHARAFELADAASEYHAAASFLVNLGTAQLDAGEFGAARASCREGARRLSLLGRERDLARVLYNLALVDAVVGDVHGAGIAVGESLRAARAAQDTNALVHALVLSSEVQSDAGARDAALEALTELGTIAERGEIENAGIAARACVVATRLALREQAQVWWQRAQDAARRTPANTVAAELELARSALASQAGRSAEAFEVAERALAQAKERGETPVLLVATLVAARAAEAVGDRAHAGLRFAEVRSLLDAAALTLPAEDRLRLRGVPAYRAALAALPRVNDAPRETESRYRKLTALAKRLTAETRLSRLYELVLDAAIDLGGAERGYLLWNDPEGLPRVRAGRGLDRQSAQADAVSRSIVSRVMSSGQALSTMDALTDARWSGADSVHALSLRSVLAVPIVSQGEVRGALYLDDRLRPFAFNDDDTALLSDLADLAAIAIESAHRSAREARALRRLHVAEQRLARRVQAQAIEIESWKRGAGPAEGFPGIVAHSGVMQDVLRLTARVAQADVPVLLRGESGTGKELVARAIHARSNRASHPFVAENCGALPESLLESTLFGHVKGAFTGADRRRMGLFEAADGGTLFLDEIAEMTPSMQTRLLRVLQDGEVRPLGGERALHVNVRVVAATHRDLEAMVEKGAFRQDLYYRLAVVSVPMPPLRDRGDDIAPLLSHFMAKHGEGRARRVQRGVVERLAAQAWPGNVRQLENEVRRALVVADDELREEHFSSLTGGEGRSGAAQLDLRGQVDDLERRLIRRALEAAAGNQTRAAELLGVSRFGLQKMLKRLELSAK